MTPARQDCPRAIKHLNISQFLDGNEIKLLQPIGNQFKFRIVAAPCAKDPDVEGCNGYFIAGGNGRYCFAIWEGKAFFRDNDVDQGCVADCDDDGIRKGYTNSVNNRNLDGV